ncbi:MAG: response regulator [Pseudomonadota bacterium]|nr:response regulator [Pseudomonadota bacterium]
MNATARPRLLIVDDEAAQMTALCDTLEEQGYVTAGFTSAKEALAVLRGQEFDLVLTDLMMPEMDGITLLRAALDMDANLIGIIMTGHGSIDTAVEAMKGGALDYILKPFKLSVIVPVLARALTVRRLRLENAELERRVREHIAELAAANQELEAFSYSVSHDLQAPLRHIDGFTGLLAKHLDSSLDATGRRYLAKVSDSARQMGELIDDLLTFSRIGRAELRRTRVDLSGLVQEVLRLLEPETAGRAIEWIMNELPEAQGDPRLLRLVFQNLVANALKYTRPKPRARIEISATRDGDDTIFSIRDNGVGFDMRYVERLFGVFQRLHTSADFEGTGIGLATVRRIVHRHGGRVWAEGEVDRGACFYVALPHGGSPRRRASGLAPDESPRRSRS